jgi:hypothetical protein
MKQIDHPTTMSLWPIFLVAAAFLLMAAAVFLFSVSIWVGIGISWVAFGILCYCVILRYFPPTPLVDDALPGDYLPGRPHSVRDVPLMVVTLIFIGVFAPFFLIGCCYAKKRGHNKSQAKDAT